MARCASSLTLLNRTFQSWTDGAMSQPDRSASRADPWDVDQRAVSSTCGSRKSQELEAGQVPWSRVAQIDPKRLSLGQSHAQGLADRRDLVERDRPGQQDRLDSSCSTAMVRSPLLTPTNERELNGLQTVLGTDVRGSLRTDGIAEPE